MKFASEIREDVLNSPRKHLSKFGSVVVPQLEACLRRRYPLVRRSVVTGIVKFIVADPIQGVSCRPNADGRPLTFSYAKKIAGKEIGMKLHTLYRALVSEQPLVDA